MATIAFMPPREEAGAMHFPHPRRLTAWSTRNEPEPSYDRIYVVRIEDANPARFRVAVRSIPVGSVRLQTDLDQTHLSQADDIVYHDRTANSGRNLDLKFKSKAGALVIFHLTDPNATFVEDEINSIVRNADDPEEILFNAKWVKGNETDRDAVSVILIGSEKATKKFDYGLGVRLNNDDQSQPPHLRYTNIIIDPKVENEGAG